MKKAFWKRILGLVLVAALIVGTFRVGSMAKAEDGITIEAEDGSKITKTRNKITVLRPDGMKIVKEATKPIVSEDGETATVDIRISVENTAKNIIENVIDTADVILLLDMSNSMKEGTKERDTKAAAKAFATTLLDDKLGGNVRVGIASFANGGINNQDLTTNLTDVCAAIDGLTPGGGTNVQYGIKRAEIMLRGSEAKYKFIVVMSDGEPTYSYTATAMDPVTTVLNDGTPVRLITSFDYSTYHGNGRAYAFSPSYEARCDIDVTFTDEGAEGDVVGYWVNESEGIRLEVVGRQTGRYTDYSVENVTRLGRNINRIKPANGEKAYYTTYITIKDNGLPTISESYLAQADGTIVFSIAYGLDANDKNGNFTMKNVASEGKFFSADADQAISSVLNTIANEITKYVTGTKLTDKFPGYMQATGVTRNSEELEDAVSAPELGNSISWTIGDLAAGVVDEIVISAVIDLDLMVAAYRGDIDEVYNGNVKAALCDPENKLLFDLNELVTLSYKDKDGKDTVDTNIADIEEDKIYVPQGQFETCQLKVEVKFVDGDITRSESSVINDFAGRKKSVLPDELIEAFFAKNTDFNADEYDLTNPTVYKNPASLVIGEDGNITLSGDTYVLYTYKKQDVPPTPTPTGDPDASPTPVPTGDPGTSPTPVPTGDPGTSPTPVPSGDPGTSPTPVPTGDPGTSPTPVPTGDPGTSPTPVPTGDPGTSPTPVPTGDPGTSPTPVPTGDPGTSPTPVPTGDPGTSPTPVPTGDPGTSPTPVPTGDPSTSPTPVPTGDPGTSPTPVPTGDPGTSPTPVPTGDPGTSPTPVPTGDPGTSPTPVPTGDPGTSPTPVPTGDPGTSPTPVPTGDPGTSPTPVPTGDPGTSPTPVPTGNPYLPILSPTPVPTGDPGTTPTPVPTGEPPVIIPTDGPEITPTDAPTGEPTQIPTPEPTTEPTPDDIEDLDDPDTPEGTPEDTPDEEIDIDDDDTPEGLPSTGFADPGILYGIGSACLALGSALVIKFKRKKDE